MLNVCNIVYTVHLLCINYFSFHLLFKLSVYMLVYNLYSAFFSHIGVRLRGAMFCSISFEFEFILTSLFLGRPYP